MEIDVRPLTKRDLPTAERIIRLAFGTFLGAPEPAQFWPDLDYAGTRWRADPNAVFAAEIDGELVGSNFATRWGSVGVFGPLTVHPEHWDRGLGSRLMEPVIDLFESWGVSHAGLFTFAHSPKHLGLYQKYGFWPRALTAIMALPVQNDGRSAGKVATFAALTRSEQTEALVACRELTDRIYPGLDVEREIRSVQEQSLGDTVLVRDEDALMAFAVCHCGPGTEAGDGQCYVKFGAAQPGAQAGEHFEALLASCETLAAARGLSRLVAGVNLARHEAYRALLARGYRSDILGVAMQRNNQEGYNRPGVYLLDDWR